MRFKLNNSGMADEVVFYDEDIECIFMPLLRRLTALRREKGRRVLAMLAAPPAAGKSTLAAVLGMLSRQEAGLYPLCVLSMDGFHRRQEWLLSHTTEHDGKTVPMTKIKGAPQTFDLGALVRGVARVAAGEACLWPRYDRILHDPVEDAVRVTGEVVLLEGNYLLLDQEGWEALRTYADYTIFVSADPALLRQRLLARHMAGGKSPKDAADIVDGSDMVNARLCLSHSASADLTLSVDGDGHYTRCESSPGRESSLPFSYGQRHGSRRRH